MAGKALSSVPGEVPVVITQPYPQGEHPIEVIGRNTAPYETKLKTLLLQLCGTGGVPDRNMEEDFGTGIAKEVQDETPEHDTGKYEMMGGLVHEIANDVAYTALMVLGNMDTEKIETEENTPSVKQTILSYFNTLIEGEILKVLPDERLNIFLTLNYLKDELCEQLIELPHGDKRERYVLSIKNAIRYIFDSVLKSGLNESLTLQINV
ncbi:hypothetical protein C0416_00850 [bacterium]|nr:hypothetical protein [bacterium]